MEWMIVQNQWTVVSETTTTSSDDVVDDPGIGKSATSIEVLDWELTNAEKSEGYSKLGSAGVVGEVEVRLVGWSCNFIHASCWEPTV